MQRFHNLIQKGVQESFSDIHISGDHKVVCRKNGKIIYTGEWYTCEQIDSLVRAMLRPNEMEMLKSRLSVDLARTINHVRVRVNVFNASRGLSLAVRLLPGKIPSFDDLNLLPELREYASQRTGLILVCGATGSGKSSTIAAFLGEICRNQSRHIVTLEDPIEYRFKSESSFIQQRELGLHTMTYEQGLLDVLRQDPDVIMVGELREPETIRLTLNAVESGHLVIASIHASNSEDALYRLCNSFPPDAQEMVRVQLSSVLSLLLVQRLDYIKEFGFRVPVLSVLRGINAVKGVIRDNRFSHIESILQTGRKDGLYTMEKYESEFIRFKKKMTPPSISFRPSEEMSEIRTYRSPLLLPQSHGSFIPKYAQHTSMPGESAMKAPSDHGMPSAADDVSGGYVIDETSTVEDVISLL